MKYHRQTLQQMQQYILQHGRTQSAYQISLNTGYGVSTIRQNATRLKVKLKAGNRIYAKQQTIAERILWIEENGAEHTILQIAKHFQVTYSCIYVLVKRYKLHVKEDRPGHSYVRVSREAQSADEQFYNDSMMVY